MVEYIKDITDFSEGSFDAERLRSEVVNSPISTVFLGVKTSQTGCIFMFDTDLTSEEETVLNSIVTTHNGLPLYVAQAAQMQVYVDALRTGLTSAGYAGKINDLEAIAVWMNSHIDAGGTLGEMKTIIQDGFVIVFAVLGALAHGYQTEKELN